MEFLNKFITNFENQKIRENKNGTNLGVVYTPNKIADFIVKSIFKIYFNDLLKKYEYLNEELEIDKIFQLILEIKN